MLSKVKRTDLHKETNHPRLLSEASETGDGVLEAKNNRRRSIDPITDKIIQAKPSSNTNLSNHARQAAPPDPPSTQIQPPNWAPGPLGRDPCCVVTVIIRVKLSPTPTFHDRRGQFGITQTSRHWWQIRISPKGTRPSYIPRKGVYDLLSGLGVSGL